MDYDDGEPGQLVHSQCNNSPTAIVEGCKTHTQTSNSASYGSNAGVEYGE